ncbi:B-cell receptor CD22-like [Engystomops pustulosus]|uniref:B-cell receptor CD22-like n=1 Tax=Engystomops pustulosus TaxID=76066 RepID=UPI003AFA6E67
MEALQQLYLLLICQGFYLGSVCQGWTFPSRITALIGSCVEIPCTYHPARTSDTSGTVWYLQIYAAYDPVVLNTKYSSLVGDEYRDRTSLVPGDKSCTLRIDPVRRGDDGGDYYPAITEDTSINAYQEQSKTVKLQVTDEVNIQLSVSDIMMEGEATTIRCAVNHTCGSSPPDLQWSKPGHVIKTSVDLKDGLWREESDLTYIPSYEDDGSLIQCTATHTNGRRNERWHTLNIEYAPKNVTVICYNVVMEGSDVTLQCNSVSRPDVSEYEWYKGETRLPDRGREMTVRSVTRDMESYSCAARNTVGRDESAPLQIPVTYAPTNVIVTVIGMDEVLEGSDVTLQCNSLSRPDVSEYEWYKGETRLPDRGREMTVRNVTRDMEPYSCVARNTVGRGESAPIQFPVIYEVSRNIILLPVIGAICLLLLSLLVYVCCRQRCKKLKICKTAANPDPTNIDIDIRDIGNDYVQTKTSPDATYCELEIKDIYENYEQIKPPISTHITGRPGATDDVYEHIYSVQKPNN